MRIKFQAVTAIAVLVGLGILLWSQLPQSTTASSSNVRGVSAREFAGKLDRDYEQSDADDVGRDDAGAGAAVHDSRRDDDDNVSAGKGSSDSIGDTGIAERRSDAASRSFATGQCEAPVKKILYIKTHKTGSSTLANMFHRFAVKHGLKLALPRDNLFYSWPNLAPERIQKVVWRHPENPSQTYDMLCSAHVRYSPSALDPLVPRAQYITVLRSPPSHVRSSWSYWAVDAHISANGGPSVSLDTFLEDPEKWWPVANKGDKHLLLNNQCFDLGLTSEPTREEVDDLIKHLDERKFFVLITDHMDESLVLLRKEMCWDIEDVLYASLKANRRKPHVDTEKDRIRRERILKMNWADALLFDHFNKTLWQKIGQYPDFQQELAEFRRQRDEISSLCRPYTHLDETAHRLQLEEKRHMSDLERRCHYILMDSMAFSKHLKWRQHAPPNELECRTQGQPRRTVVLRRTSFTGDEVLANMMIRFGIGRVTSFAIPNSKVAAALASGSAMDEATKKEPFCHVLNRDKKRAPLNIVIPPLSLRASQGTLARNLDHTPYFVAVFRDPAARVEFLWKHHNLDKVVSGAAGKRVTFQDFAEEPDKYAKHIPQDVVTSMRSGMARDLGWNGLEDQTQSTKVDMFASNAVNGLSMVLIAEKPVESLVLFRRIVCWSEPEMELFAMMPNRTVHGVSPIRPFGWARLTEAQKKNLRAFAWVDWRLYSRAVERLTRSIGSENSFELEVLNYKDQLVAVDDKCGGLQNQPFEWHLHQANGIRSNSQESACSAMYLHEDALLKIARERQNRWTYNCNMS